MDWGLLRPLGFTATPATAPSHPRAPRVDVRRMRKETRFPAPLLDLPLLVELVLEDEAQRYVGRLWDISRSGACVRLQEKVFAGENGVLRIRDPGARQVIETLTHTVWSRQISESHFLGLRFPEPLDPQHTFLSQLMRQS